MGSKKTSFKKQLIELKDRLEDLEENINFLNKKINTGECGVVLNSVGSYKHSYKYGKVLKVLEYLKKEHSEYFTLNDYKKVLIIHFGQNDTRTVKSDIEMLELTNQIIKKDQKYYFQ